MSATVDQDTIQAMYKNGKPKEEVFSLLIQSGVEEPRAQELVHSWQQAKRSARQSTGFVVVGIGAVLCFISCMVTLLQLTPGMGDFMLYGLTTIGATIIVAGLWLVFES